MKEKRKNSEDSGVGILHATVSFLGYACIACLGLFSLILIAALAIAIFRAFTG